MQEGEEDEENEDQDKAASSAEPAAPSAGALARKQAQAAAAQAEAAQKAAAAAAAGDGEVAGDVPDLDTDEDAVEMPVEMAATAAGPWRPPLWPEPNANIQAAISEMTDEVLTIVGEKREGWPAKLRNVVSAQLIPLGWESDYPPDKTTAAKVCFLGAKALYEKDLDNEDLLSEGRTLAENAFEDGGDMQGGKMIKAYAALYGAKGDTAAEELILEDMARVIAAKGYPEDLVPVPEPPEYSYKDKWNIKIAEPEAMGGQEIEVAVRPKQQFRLLANAWLKMNALDEDKLADYEFVVPEQPKTWRSGPIDINDEIGDTGILDGTGFQVIITNPDADMAARSAEA